MTYPAMSPWTPWSLVRSGFHKAPSFNNLRQMSATGRGNSALAVKPYATWAFELDLSAVDGGESVQYSVIQKFLGCVMATCSGASPFLFTDPNDNTVDDTGLDTPQSLLLNVTPGAAVPMGVTGDGVSTIFQLGRSIDQGVDILQQVSSALILVNGAVLTSGVSVSSTGVATFTTAPANGAVLGWSGSFQYLCRFTDDTLKDLARVNKNATSYLWDCGSIAFESEFV